MPSVLAQDIPLLTLQAKNIQVRAEWEKVGDAGNHFRLDGGTLVLTSTISGAGKPEGNAITVIVKVRDKFSTLNPSYKDLAVMVTIRAVIMGCRADRKRYFAKSRTRESSDPPNQIIMQEKEDIAKGAALAHRYTDENGLNHIYLYTVSATHGKINNGNPLLTAEPTSFTELTEPSLYDNLYWDYTPGSPTDYKWTPLWVNESVDCFAEEVETFYFNTHAPLISGVQAGLGRTVIVASAFVNNNQQIFSLDDVELANILNERYTIKVIVDDGKAFTIVASEQKGDTYEYFANLTDGSVTVQNTISHEVIVLNHDCPLVYNVGGAGSLGEGVMYISFDDNDKVKAYVLIDGEVYKSRLSSPGVVAIEGYLISMTSGSFQLKFADHFLCENI